MGATIEIETREVPPMSLIFRRILRLVLDWLRSKV